MSWEINHGYMLDCYWVYLSSSANIQLIAIITNKKHGLCNRDCNDLWIIMFTNEMSHPITLVGPSYWFIYLLYWWYQKRGIENEPLKNSILTRVH